MRIGRVRVYARAVPARTCGGYHHTATKAEFPLMVPALQRHKLQCRGDGTSTCGRSVGGRGYGGECSRVCHRWKSRLYLSIICFVCACSSADLLATPIILYKCMSRGYQCVRHFDPIRR